MTHYLASPAELFRDGRKKVKLICRQIDRFTYMFRYKQGIPIAKKAVQSNLSKRDLFLLEEEHFDLPL
jgi:hypothetical protein